MQMSKKKVAAVLITTAAVSISTIGVATAASKSSTTRVSTTSVSTSGIKGPRADFAAVLASLVTKGTITQAQSDAIVKALDEARAADMANGPKGRKGAVGPDRAATLTLISKTLGIDEATIKSRLAAGETLAAIAGSKKDALIAALVADETKRIDAAVTAGKLTADQATKLKANLTAHVTEEVNSTRPMGGKGGPGMGDKRGHGRMGGGMAGSGTTTLTLPSTPNS
jgi:hypothetical protein